MMFACPLSPEITYAYTSLEKGSFVSELRTHFIRNQASLSGDCMPQERVWFVRGFSQTSPWCCTAESLTSWNPSLFFVFASLYLSEYFCRLKYVNTLDVYFCFLFFFLVFLPWFSCIISYPRCKDSGTAAFGQAVFLHQRNSSCGSVLYPAPTLIAHINLSAFRPPCSSSPAREHTSLSVGACLLWLSVSSVPVWLRSL